jgi:hypothetical protein
MSSCNAFLISLSFRYIIKYKAVTGISTSLPPRLSSGLPFERTKLEPNRIFDPKNRKHWEFRLAESYLNGSTARQINFIEYIDNKRLQAQFDAKKKDFSINRIPDGQIYAFHATQPVNIDNILKNNLNYRRTANGRAHGDGCYFSEFPDFSLKYGQGLILFEVLPGKEYEGNTLGVPTAYNCKKVSPNAEGCGQQLIITNSDQFIPRFVYHWK